MNTGGFAMSKVITVRLSDEEYEKISGAARNERRPISNYITSTVIKDIEESYFADSVEMSQISSDKALTEKLRKGHLEAKKMKGKFIE
jgi:predicted DNA-binding protein